MDYRFWEDHEVDALRKMAGQNMTDKEMAKLLDRTEPSVRARRRDLGILRRKAKPRIKWTLEKMTALREMALGGMVDKFIAHRLGISEDAVERKRRHMGIRRHRKVSNDPRLISRTVSFSQGEYSRLATMASQAGMTMAEFIRRRVFE